MKTFEVNKSDLMVQKKWYMLKDNGICILPLLGSASNIFCGTSLVSVLSLKVI